LGRRDRQHVAEEKRAKDASRAKRTEKHGLDTLAEKTWFGNGRVYSRIVTSSIDRLAKFVKQHDSRIRPSPLV
jgi:hypothetical protein